MALSRLRRNRIGFADEIRPYVATSNSMSAPTQVAGNEDHQRQRGQREGYKMSEHYQFMRDFFRLGSDSTSAGVAAPSCPYCGNLPHANIGQCPNVKRIEYYPDGTVKSVEKRP